MKTATDHLNTAQSIRERRAGAQRLPGGTMFWQWQAWQAEAHLEANAAFRDLEADRDGWRRLAGAWQRANWRIRAELRELAAAWGQVSHWDPGDECCDEHHEPCEWYSTHFGWFRRKLSTSSW